ncbi:HAD family hydrolase [Defluviitalea saccharophila]|uniref:HAD family hydrolase n=1 Tax=Defluviitalea saccharophila TaxID=879970 RepID=A0ABZ2Y618_9FIRM|nr:HAD family hydrolase [Candidatus Epulonipiscium sp.]
MKTKLIIFDLDGTLVDTIEGIGFSMNKVLENHGFPTHSIEAYRGFVGNGLKNLAKRTLPEDHRDEETIDLCYKEMLDVYSQYYSRGIALYPGIDSLLDQLTKEGYTLAINTNKDQRITEYIVKELLSKWNFIKVIGDEGGYPKKPNPEAALAIAAQGGFKAGECVYVGDSEVDYKTAVNAGMKSVLVLWGFRSREELIKLNPEGVIESPHEIFKMINP